LAHLLRKSVKHQQLSFSPEHLTVVIICYNGEDIIEETIRQANTHVPLDRIYVVSDASTDNTDTVAARSGAKVFRNKKNINKAFSISAVMKHVNTKYVLLLDDDTLIKDTFIPTNLLDEGYSAVAFNVMPVEEDYFINALQQFEYRKSMYIGKNLRSRVGAIGNVSGAIGLFRTEDLKKQVPFHSGQFGGEDEQRTVLVHLQAAGNGIAYTDSTVLTLAPRRLRHLFKQRTFSWNLSTPELFTMYWRVLLSPKHHYLLKAEKAYSLYIYVTDPLRMLFYWILFTRPTHVFAAYGFYAFLSLVVWLKTKRKDKLYIVLLFPIYSFFLSICRFISHFYWFKVKLRYFFSQKYHRLVPGRKLRLEFVVVLLVNVLLWSTAIMHLKTDVNLLKKVQNHRIDEFDTETFAYSEEIDGKLQLNNQTNLEKSDIITVSLAVKESKTSIAHKIVQQYLAARPDTIISDETHQKYVNSIADSIADITTNQSLYSYTINVADVEKRMINAREVL
jgi:cellulose synthase/poly-beta-1,6-N-acetylglucosamine synthase-like glycosyltransferase